MQPPDLGYRGFNIRDYSSGEQFPAVITIYGGTITITANDQQISIADEHLLEQQLLQDATDLGWGETISASTTRQDLGVAVATP